MKTIDKHTLIGQLNLTNPYVMGNMLEALANVYEDAGYQTPRGYDVLPSFLKEMIGPELSHLPSFAVREAMHKKTKHPEPIVHSSGGNGFPGLGHVVETMHADMRKLAARVSRLFHPSILEILPGLKMHGAFDPSQVDRLAKHSAAAIQLDETLPPLTVRGKRIRYNAFLIGAGAQAILSRSDEEKSALRNSIGSLKSAYFSTLNLIRQIAQAMKKSRAYRGKNPSDYGLSPRVDDIAEAICARQREFHDSYNFMYVVTQGRLAIGLKQLKQLLSDPPANASIVVDTPMEAAATLSGLCVLMGGVTGKEERKICDSMANAATSHDAARILAQSDLLDTLAESIRDSYRDDVRHFAQSIVTLLEQFKDRHAPAPWSEKIREQPQTIRRK